MTARNVISWLPCLLLPAAVIGFTPDAWPPWAFMWLLAFAVYASTKWLTWQSALPTSASSARQIGYLLAWPGLDAPAFLEASSPQRPALKEWLFAVGKLGLGIGLIAVCVPRLPVEYDLARGWVGMVGIIFVLHFGLFHLLSLCWRSVGVDAKPLMHWPILATSVSDFWSRRWNTAFRDLTHRFLFRPLTVRFGPRIALAIGFLFSGLVHDLIISLPARGGYGGPTLFFVVQGAAIFLERSAFGRRLGLGAGVRGWAFALMVLVGPACLLFHPPFVRGVVVPFLDWVLQQI